MGHPFALKHRMKLRTLFFLFSPLAAWSQQTPMKEVIMRTHTNGKPHVVLYFNPITDELIKEQVYYSNGKTEWLGYYKNNTEDGVWEFYWDNGQLKSKEVYSKGKENGTCYNYDRNGKLIKESVWKNGKLIQEIKH